MSELTTVHFHGQGRDTYVSAFVLSDGQQIIIVQASDGHIAVSVDGVLVFDSDSRPNQKLVLGKL